MEKILVHITELRNKTNQVVEFEVENDYIHIRALPPAGKKRHVKLWKVLEACRKHGCAQWKIRFMMNKEFTGLELNAFQLLQYARITIKLESMGEGLYLPYLEAIPEKRIDHLLRLKFFGCMRNKCWDKRPYISIRPDQKRTKGLRVVEVESPPQLEVPVAKDQSLLQRVVEVQSPPKLEVPLAKDQSLHKRQITNDVASSVRERGEKVAISLDMNDKKRIVSPAAALQPEEQGPPNRERIERGSGGNMLELPQQRENTDDLYSSSIKCKDMEKAVRLMLLVIAFICVLLTEFMV